MPWPLLLSFRQLFPPRKFPVFATVSILGVALGVAALLIVQTVMFSFGEEHRRRIRERFGDIVLAPGLGDRIADSKELIRTVSALPDVRAVAPSVDGQIIIERRKDDIVFAQIRGIDIMREAQVSPLTKYIELGVADDLDDDRVIVGATLARRLRVYPGDTLTLQSPTRVARSLNGEKLDLPKQLEVCGLLHTGFDEVDDNLIVTTLRTARSLAMFKDGEISQLRVMTGRKENIPAVRDAIAKVAPEARSYAWYEFKKQFLDAVAMEKQMLFLLMFIITLVASFSIGSTLFSHVVRRNREIGLLGALGAKPRQILALFVSQGFLVGLFGYGLGVGLTFLVMTFRNEIINVIGAQDTMLKQYKFDNVPLYYNAGDFLNAALLTLGLMTVAALIPAVWASRRKPSEAMRDA